MRGAERLGRVELDGFRLVRVLGEGSFGTAYLAEQAGIDRLAVVKIAHPSAISGPLGAEIRARFASEVRAATRIRHPGLCTVYTFGETSDQLPAIAMEYIDGETLRARFSRLRNRPMPIGELTEVFLQLATVLEAVHGQNIVHRDVSPNNVMLSMDHEGRLQVKLVDFGIAALTERSSGEFIAGTPGYAAPEQFRGATSASSDLFGFGALLWWAATGRELMEEILEAERLIAAFQTLEHAPDPAAIYPEISAPLARMIRGLLDPNPAFRPSLEEVREELTCLQNPNAGPSPRRVLVIDPDGLLGAAVLPTFASYGVRVLTTNDPRRATRSDGEFGAFLISARLEQPTAAQVYQHLLEFHPETPTLVLAAGAWNVRWDDVPFEARVRLPGGNYRIVEIGEQLRTRRQTIAPPGLARIASTDPTPEAPPTRPPPSLRPDSRRAPGSAAWTAWTGGMPNLLLELEAALAEGGDVTAVCLAIEALAREAGVREVTTLAHTLRMLLATGDLEHPASFLTDLEGAYVRAIRAQNAPNSQPISEVPPTPVRPWSRS